MAARRASCGDSYETYEGIVANVQRCADLCKGKASMFVYGTTLDACQGQKGIRWAAYKISTKWFLTVSGFYLTMRTTFIQIFQK